MPPINWAPAKRSFVGKRRSDGALRTIPELKNNSGIVSGAESAPTWQRGWDSKSVARQACTRLLANIACIRLFFDVLYLISGFLLWQRGWDSNPRTGISRHTISSRAPSTSSATSPSDIDCIKTDREMQVGLLAASGPQTTAFVRRIHNGWGGGGPALTRRKTQDACPNRKNLWFAPEPHLSATKRP